MFIVSHGVKKINQELGLSQVLSKELPCRSKKLCGRVGSESENLFKCTPAL